MIKYAFMASCVVLGSAHAQSPSGSQSGPPVVHVNVDSEAKDLARGYERASSQLTRPPVTLGFEKAGTVYVLEDIRSVKASDGIVVVEVGKGLTYLINSKDILYITDGPVPKSRS